MRAQGVNLLHGIFIIQRRVPAVNDVNGVTVSPCHGSHIAQPKVFYPLILFLY